MGCELCERHGVSALVCYRGAGCEALLLLFWLDSLN